MLIILLTIITVSLILLIASYFDLKTGEIPDEVSFALILIPALISGAYSIFKGDYSFFITSASIGVAYFILGYIPFRIGYWGGGDLKLFSGIGCTLGFLGSTGYLKDGIIPYPMFYFVNIGLIAFPYAIAYALIFSFRTKQRVFPEFGNYLRRKNSVLLFILSFMPSFIAFLLKLKIMALVYLLLPLFLLASLYLKAFEKIALLETVNIEKLREGDIMAQDLISEGKRIAGKFSAEGLTQEQIREIQKLSLEKKIPDTITIKNGIKFAPVLLITFLFTVFIGDIIGAVFNIIS